MRHSDPKAINDGQYRTWAGAFRAGTPQPENPAWVAIKVGGGYRRLLLVWSDGGSYNYRETTYGSPADYRIDVSADSTDGSDGSWLTVVSVEGNQFHARGHSFDFAGKRWVKFVMLRAPANSPNGLSLDEIDLHDMSGGGTDTWFFMGDSITAHSFDRASDKHQPSFQELVHRSTRRYMPAMINGGIGGESSRHALEHIDEWLALNSDFKYWPILYGTNDSAGNTQNTADFEANMRGVIARIKAAGRVPILARIPHAPDGGHEHLSRFNQVIDRLTMKQGLIRGPDLHGWFSKHPQQLYDKLHPNERGIIEINRLWWSAVRFLYVSEE